MSYKVQRAMALSGVALIVLTFGGFLLAGLLPVPPGANLTAAQIAAFYGTHTTVSRLGFLLAATGLGFLAQVHRRRKQRRRKALLLQTRSFAQLLRLLRSLSSESTCGATTLNPTDVPELLRANASVANRIWKADLDRASRRGVTEQSPGPLGRLTDPSAG